MSAIVPARQAADWLGSCLIALRANGPAEIIVVTGPSTDGTEALAAQLADRVIDDEGAGVAAARMLGAEAAAQPWVAMIDVDVLLPSSALETLLGEADERKVMALQADLVSTGAGDYWSSALVHHHGSGRSRHWFGLGATLIRRDVLLKHPLDATFRSGEDLEYRYRLEALKIPFGVSRRVVARHRFGRGFDFARDQWLADGAGWGRLARRYGPIVALRAMTPFGAALRGMLLSLPSGYRWIPYYLAFMVGNLCGFLTGLSDPAVARSWRGVAGAPTGAADVVADTVLGLAIGTAATAAYVLGALRTVLGALAFACVLLLVIVELVRSDKAGFRIASLQWLMGSLVLCIGAVQLLTILRLIR